MKEIKDEAFKFLLYSYFGAEEINEDIKEKCAYRAYLDLARTVKYTYPTSEKNTKFEGKKKDRIEKITECILEEINNYPGGAEDFDAWHYALCNKIIERMKEDRDGKIVSEFTYGQAQKWLNMTLKYLWMIDLLPESINETYLHVPIDSYIIDAIIGKKKVTELHLEIKKSKGDILNIPWSQWNDSEGYKKIQEVISENIKNIYKSRIEWESKAWIAVAKDRKEKEKNKKW